MNEKRRRGFWGTLGCLVGLHDWRVDRCRGIPSKPGMAYWFEHDNFDWRCVRCGKARGRNVRQCGNIVMGDMAGGDIVKPKQPNAEHHARSEAT
jgi:hypothetical protein